jgi:hypothetical protein
MGMVNDVRDRDHLGRFAAACDATSPDAVRGALVEINAEGRGHLPVHVYPDGPAPYFTIIALGVRAQRSGRWSGDAARRSCAGATITHHHAVSRDRRYDQRRPPLFARRCDRSRQRSTRATLNPGVLIDP